MLFGRMNMFLEKIDETIYRNANNAETAKLKINLSNFINENDKFQVSALNYYFINLLNANDQLEVGVDEDNNVYLIKQAKQQDKPKPLNWQQLNQIVTLASINKFDSMANALDDQIVWSEPVHFINENGESRTISKLKMTN